MNEEIPEEWCHSILVPIFKGKGGVQDCEKYRGWLLSHKMKLWERIVGMKLREEVDMAPEQFTFMPGRGTLDAVSSAAIDVEV